MLHSLLTTITTNRSELANLKKGQISQSTKLLNYATVKNLKFDYRQFLSFILFTPGRYLNWIDNDKCRLYALLENGLIKDAQGVVKKVLFFDPTINNIRYIDIHRFIKIIYKKECLKNRTIKKLFSPKHLASTIKKLSLIPPKNSKECHKKFRRLNTFSDYLPYLCSMAQQNREYAQLLKTKRQLAKENKLIPYRLLNQLKKISLQRKILSKYQRSDIAQFCQHFTDPQTYCNKQLHADFWQSLAAGKEPEYEVKYICQSIYSTNKLSSDQFAKCISILKHSPQVCITANYHSTPSLLPHPSCQELARNLSNSNLYTDYQDCPAIIANTYVTNLSRIIHHFVHQPVNTGQYSCSNLAYNSLAQLFFRYDPQKKIGTQICFKHPIKLKNICYNFLPGAGPQVKGGEGQVLAKILHLLKGAPLNTQCRFIPKKEFNPHLLQFQTGCVVTYRDSNCINYGCPKDIYYNALKVKGIKYKGKLLLDYRPTTFSHSLYALNKQLKKVYKIREKIIHNLTEAKFFLQLNKNNIIHGIGCAEDIYPQRFPRYALNQCRPLPFIIDGIRQDRNQSLLITRTAIDDLHSPRAINWTVLYSAIKSFQQIHPLESWSLYGLRH